MVWMVEEPQTLHNAYLHHFIEACTEHPLLSLGKNHSTAQDFLHYVVTLRNLAHCCVFWIDILHTGKSTSGFWLEGIIVDFDECRSFRTLLPQGPLRRRRYFGLFGIKVILGEFQAKLIEMLAATPYNYCREFL